MAQAERERPAEELEREENSPPEPISITGSVRPVGVGWIPAAALGLLAAWELGRRTEA